MHSPNDIPSLGSGKFKPIMSNTIYLLHYSQYHIRRLGYGYDTDCRDYDNGHDESRLPTIMLSEAL